MLFSKDFISLTIAKIDMYYLEVVCLADVSIVLSAETWTIHIIMATKVNEFARWRKAQTVRQKPIQTKSIKQHRTRHTKNTLGYVSPLIIYI